MLNASRLAATAAGGVVLSPVAEGTQHGAPHGMDSTLTVE